MKKTIGILAHVDAGKTTFSEQLLYHTKSIQKCGRVDHKDTFFDNNIIERQRGITIFSKQGLFDFNGSRYYLIDTPGHIDFSAEMERAVKVLDYAVIILSAVEGVQAHTKTVWRILEKYNVPTILFINKIDRKGADYLHVIHNINKNLTEDAVFLEAYKDKQNDSYVNYSDSLIESICERDDSLLEKYLDGNLKKDILREKFNTLIKERKIFPVFKGSALQDEGITEFINALDELTFTNYDKKEEKTKMFDLQIVENLHNDGKINDEKFIGYVYKIYHDDSGNRITFLKCLNGQIKVKDVLIYGENEDDKKEEKINSIRLYNGEKFKSKDAAEYGDIVGITGLSKAECGQYVGILREKTKYEIFPAFVSKVVYDESKINPKDMLNRFKILESEDPSLKVEWDEHASEINVHIMGKIQLEILKNVVKNRFNIDVCFGECNILYKESIKNKVIGRGHFEPLRHYAEVHLKMEPLPKNTGITFENKCSNDDLAPGFQNLIKTHIFEKEHKGILTGSPITDIKFTLLNGRSHLKHTCGGDFREATYRAIRQGLEKAENILLEPYYKFIIEIDESYIGRILTDIERMKGTFESPENIDGKVTIKGRGPASEFMDYSLYILEFTRGTGSMSLIYDGYDDCHNTDEVIEKRAYKKDADINCTGNSVFCAHGSGYIVKWDESDKKMHIDIESEEI
ncbi:TetM/TetW/TetO/TetS family tetracycline resistance ribosomal protection protein [Clostridium sp. BJN0001]|uniref:GTP-binding protein n=1 Tax=Clostridium sp. BJN0001 TaxID=2930219 RepID=UPI001FD564EE|nr:TetM/TetW/TetO/TetS family tetracycline resistance ribosomal protection protein [Clostridium sp. BJN0001]